MTCQKNLKILYHLPNPDTIYAGRTIANGYKNAILDSKHEFLFLTAHNTNTNVFAAYNPDIFITSLNQLSLKYLDLSELLKAKKRGTQVYVNVSFWNSPINKMRLSETGSLKENSEYIKLIKSNEYGDIFFNACEQGDERMDGFEKTTGKKHYTLLLAADKTIIYPEYDQKYSADVSFIGTNLPEKRAFFRDVIKRLSRNYDIRLYGQDWNIADRYLGILQKAGQLYNVPFIRSIRKPKLPLSAERKIYTSTLVSINVHEEYQKKYGDLNERTFKIPLAGGFEIIDSVSTVTKHFEEDKEIVIAHDESEWFEKIEYYVTHPEKRLAIIAAGKKKVLNEHTYHNRLETMLCWYKNIAK